MTTPQPTHLPIQHLQPNPFQPREKVVKTHLAELVESIKLYGILEPLVVAQTPAGYQIIAGERRWRAAREAGLTEVPVIIRKTTPKGMLEMAIVENVQRTNLNPLERAQAFQQLMRDFGLTLTEIGERISKSVPYVSNTLKLLDLPDAIKDGLVSKQITEGHARALATIKDEKGMIECYKRVLKESASVRRTEELARHLIEKIDQQIYSGNKIYQVPEDLVKEWQNRMQHTFSAKSKLRLSRSRLITKVSITLKGNPEETQQDFDKIIQFITETEKKQP